MRVVVTFLICFSLFISCSRDSDLSEYPSLFEQVWDDFAHTYPYFEHKGIDWNQTYDRFAERVNEVTSDEEMLEIFREILEPLRDIHVLIKNKKEYYRYSKKSKTPLEYLENLRLILPESLYENKRVFYTILPEYKVSYLKVDNFGGSINNYVDFPKETIISSIARQEALILDIRGNGGGQENFAIDLASRFMPTTRYYGYSRSRLSSELNDFDTWESLEILPWQPIAFDKPILILVDRFCYSAAESFLLMMKTLPNVKLIGETTGGASGTPRQSYLPDGWTYMISTQQKAALDYTLIEDNGIQPDYHVATPQTINEGIDPFFEKALELSQ